VFQRVRGLDRKCENEGGSFAWLRLGPDSPTLCLHDTLADCEANTGAGIFLSRVQAFERRKYR
jgi:hypothetical protein